MATILTNRAQITFNGSDAVLSNQTNTTLVDTNTMELTKTAVDNSILAGSDAVYVLRLENTGANTLGDITLTDNLGKGALTYVDGTAQFFKNGSPVQGTAEQTSQTCEDDYDELVFTTAETLASGDNLIIIYAASTDEMQTEDIVNKVKAKATAECKTSAVVKAKACETITIESAANVSIFKSADKDTVVSGDTLTYTFTLMNTGGEAAENVNFSDAFPQEFTVTDVSYTVDGTETPIPASDYTIEDPNTLIIPAEGSDLSISIPAATSEGPGITVITVTGTIQ